MISKKDIEETERFFRVLGDALARDDTEAIREGATIALDYLLTTWKEIVKPMAKSPWKFALAVIMAGGLDPYEELRERVREYLTKYTK